MWVKFGNRILGTGSLCAAIAIAITIAVHYNPAAFTIVALALRTEISWTVEQHTDS